MRPLGTIWPQTTFLFGHFAREHVARGVGHTDSSLSAGTPTLLGEFKEARIDLGKKTGHDGAVAPHIRPARNGREAGIGPIRRRILS